MQLYYLRYVQLSWNHETRRMERSGDIKILDAIYLKWEYVSVFQKYTDTIQQFSAAGHHLCNTSKSVYIYNVQWKKLNFYRILSNELKKLICSHRCGERM